jgi:hypothetical protein
MALFVSMLLLTSVPMFASTLTVNSSADLGGTCPGGPNLPSMGVRLVGVYFPANGKFYGMGGSSSDTAGSDFMHPFEYDPSSNSWTTKSATYPDNQVNNMACGVLADSGTPYIYCVGGSTAGATLATGRVFRYDPVTDVVIPVAASWPQGALNILPGGFTIFQNKLYILGGFDIPNGIATNQIWEFTPGTNAWVQKAAVLPVPLGYIPTTTIGSFIYTGGGSAITGGAITDTTNAFVYNPMADTIGTIATIPRATGETRGLTFNGKMYVMGGGRVAPNPSTELDIYDPGTNSWSIGAPFMTARRNFATATDGSTHIWLAGGYDSTSASTALMEILGQCSPTLVKITSINRLANGHIVLHGVGRANATYSVQASPDLSPLSFTTLAPASDAADGFGLFQYDDAGAVGLTKRFYRILPVPYSVNLIVNGNAELGASDFTGQPVTVPAWVATGPFTVVPYGAAGGFPTPTDPGPPDRLNQFFAGGNGALSTASQDIDVSGNAADIKPGRVTCDLSAWLGGFFTDQDNATLTLTFFNGANNLGGSSLGPVTAAQRGNQTGLLLRSLTALQVPPNTTRLHLVLTMTRASGSFNDAYADSLSLVLHVQ